MHWPLVIWFVIWFVVALAVVATGALARIPVPPPVIVAVLSLATIAIVLLSKARTRVMSVDVRALLAVHLVRFVGIAFLVLVSRGVLSPAFTPIGWGDALAATGALLLIALVPKLSPAAARWSLLAWNTFGFADMLLLLVTGIRLGRTDPAQFALFRQLPFGLLPAFFVPLIIATHVFLFVRLRRDQR